MQRPIPCVMMRGGTSRGLYFRASDLPQNEAVRDAVLLSAMGSADASQIDGVGGATSVTSKVAIVSPSSHPWADVDYLFAQVGVEKPVVDTAPSCGNILAGVGPFAIESGFVPAQVVETTVRIHNENTGALIECVVQTPNRQVCYEGDTAIDGVPGKAAPIALRFRNIAGSKTDRLLPTGKPRDTVSGVPVTCVDLAIPMVLVAAESLGKSGYETKEALDADSAFLTRLEAIRKEAAKLMGLGGVADSVVPKIAILAPPNGKSGLSSRYFVPNRCHAAHAATGAICIAGAALVQGTIAHELHRADDAESSSIRVEHPKGAIEVSVQADGSGASTEIRSASVIRTARPIFSGQVFVSSAAWPLEEVNREAA